MLNQPYGLRFDIYERVHLSEGVPAIEELEEIELYPRIQVIGQDDHATLRGHLLLTGAYRGESEESEELKHFIPVEITVPLNRVRSIDDISIEIENFDVDLLSSRSLNITGVLSLRGIEGFPVEEPQVWTADEFTVVHSPEAQPDSRADELGQTEASAQSEQYEQPGQYDSLEQYQQLGRTDQAYEQQVQVQRGEKEELANAAELAAYGSPESADLSLRVQTEPNQEERLQSDWSPAADPNDEAPTPISSFLAETADRLASYPESEPLLPIEGEATVAWSEPPIGSSLENAIGSGLENAIGSSSENAKSSSTESAALLRSEEERKQLEQHAPEVWHFEEARSGGQQGEQDAGSAPAQVQTENWQDVFASSEAVNVEVERNVTETAEEEASLQNEESIPEPIAEAEDKPELKVAFGSKKETSPRSEEGVGISSLLASSGRSAREADGERTEEAPAGAVPEDESQTEEVEWKNLFLGTIVDQNPFRKVKLCIVQREDTLDAIADRYQLSTRELQLYNRLTEQVVEEGQILYIP
ncbi:LysM peptidoglycan-binding domain-containing protein [Paenibacillus silvae]|uniref:LysM peptidoglycan-binding domain-containing protein n=1 Tax=Paenibacillus silvae TaxID=1325358 RepID=UPI002004FFB0|nr:LysM peptidoglycan-binding domain-containing protein [Paenibacillus silvae]MCK6076086.1 LysM peptidoglycan-binding domain-containing protein [Paenibacillus silvae]MCK6150755.1 LysM peptidoglycan-binding domain-containing protein [Paenibacillus silvae]MCK6269015.1 LysM peptidoglycan-binding domain-containing protein [Paenibacillus silvae]